MKDRPNCIICGETMETIPWTSKISCAQTDHFFMIVDYHESNYNFTLCFGEDLFHAIKPRVSWDFYSNVVTHSQITYSQPKIVRVINTDTITTEYKLKEPISYRNAMDFINRMNKLKAFV